MACWTAGCIGNPANMVTFLCKSNVFQMHSYSVEVLPTAVAYILGKFHILLLPSKWCRTARSLEPGMGEALQPHHHQKSRISGVGSPL